MSDPKYLKVETIDAVARVTLDRPKHNVLNIEMMRELIALLSALKQDRDLKAVLFLAEGRSWCAGVEVGDHKPALVDDMVAAFGRMLQLVESMPVPTIAAVHGACLGGGMELAIACDMVAASSDAVFGQPEIKLGFFPPYAAVRLPVLVGPAKAIEICTTGCRYTAEEARAMGFVSRVCAAEAFAETVAALVKEITVASPLILRLNKQAVMQHLGMPADAALDGSNRLFLETLMKTSDTLEGIASFEEKRRPLWKNA